MIPIDNNETDAKKAVLIETKTGADHTDWFFSDMRDTKPMISSKSIKLVHLGWFTLRRVSVYGLLIWLVVSYFKKT